MRFSHDSKECLMGGSKLSADGDWKIRASYALARYATVFQTSVFEPGIRQG